MKRLPIKCISGASVAAALVTLALAASPEPAAAKSCLKSGDKVVSRTDEAIIVSQKNARRGWTKRHAIVYGCSFKYGKRVRLMDVGLKLGVYREFGIHESNSRYVAFVPLQYDEGYPDLAVNTNVHVVDLRSGRTTTNAQAFSEMTSPAGPYVSKLALNNRGWIGWISDAYDLDQGHPIYWPNEVHLRDSGKARIVARGDDIELEFLRWDQNDSELIWTTTNTSAPAR